MGRASAEDADPVAGNGMTCRRALCQRLQHRRLRLPGSQIVPSVPLLFRCAFVLLCLLGANIVAGEEDAASTSVPNLCHLSPQEPMYCRCESEHFEAEVTGVTCLVGKPLTGDHVVFQSLRRQKSLTSVTFTVYGQDYRLDFVPTETLKQLGQLDRLTFTECNLGVLPTKAFYKLSALSLLQLEGNEILDLQKDAIAHLPRLEKLEMGDNKLRRVGADWFSRLPALGALFLGKNQIEVVEDMAFAELGALQELELGDNLIVELSNRTFKGLSHLKRLDLFRNKLVRLEARVFSGMPLLEELDLKLNQISVVDPLAFDGLARLRVIFLASNQLRILPADMFVGAPNLAWVDLSQNQLLTLTWRTIHNLKQLEDGEDFEMSVTGNRFTCDCRLSWMLKLENLTKSEKFRRELRHVKCDFGDPERGSSKVTRLSLEDLGCSDYVTLDPEPEELPPVPAFTTTPSPPEKTSARQPDSEFTSREPEVQSKPPDVVKEKKKQEDLVKKQSPAPKDKPASSAAFLSSAFTLIVSALFCSRFHQGW